MDALLDLTFGRFCLTALHERTVVVAAPFGQFHVLPLDDFDAKAGHRSPNSLRERFAPERPTPARQNDHREEKRGRGEPYVIPEHRARLGPDQDQHRQGCHEEELRQGKVHKHVYARGYGFGESERHKFSRDACCVGCTYKVPDFEQIYASSQNGPR